MVSGKEAYHHELRIKLADFMIENKRQLLQMFVARKSPEEEYEKHVKDLRKSAKWADDSDIWAMASMLNTSIATYHKFGNRWTWAEHKPLRSTGPISHLPPAEGKIYLHNVNSNHYDVVLDI